jgi:hypothetical protein
MKTRYLPTWSLLVFLVTCTTGCSRGESGVDRAENVMTENLDPGGAPAGSGSALVMRAVDIPDPARGNMPAYRFLVPKGWSVEGGVNPVPSGYHMIPYLSDITIKSPDKRGVRFWGINEFGFGDGVSLPPFTPYQGRPFMPPQQSLGNFWQLVFQISPAPGITNLRIVSEEMLPEATQLIRQQLAPLYQSTAQENASLAMSGERKTFDAHARQLVIQYEDNGTPVEATIFASVRHSIYYYPTGRIRAAMWNLDNMYAVFGPVGSDYLNDPELAAIVRSREELPDWQVAVQQWYLMKNRQIVSEGQARIAAAARSAAVTSSAQSEDVLDISFNGWKRRNAMSDAGQAATVNSIHERTTYATPAGNTVNLPSYYQNVYTDQQGNYILHNDANYRINTDPAFNSRDWQRIEPVR